MPMKQDWPGTDGCERLHGENVTLFSLVLSMAEVFHYEKLTISKKRGETRGCEQVGGMQMLRSQERRIR